MSFTRSNDVATASRELIAPALVVRPARTRQRKAKLQEVVADAHRRYGPVFKKLAE
jgi:hypothetical protein